MSRSLAPSLSLSLLLSGPLVLVTLASCGEPADTSEGEGEGGEEGEGEEGEGEEGEGEGEGEEGEGEGEGEEGEGEGPPPPVPANDTCANAEEITSGVSKSGTTLGANDETPCSDADFDDNEGGADVAYTFTIADIQGVVINVSEDDIDAVVSVFSADQGCNEETFEPGTCVDNAVSTGEDIELPALAAGTYFIVVESFGEPGDFDLRLDIVDPICVGDQDDQLERFDGTTGNETAETALALSAPGFGNGFLSQNSSTVEDEIELQLCDGDIDYYLIGHLGGPLTIEATGTVTELREAVVDVAATLETDALVYTEGTAVAGLPGSDVDVAAGFYLLRITEDQVLEVPDFLAYDVVVTHACEADDLDLPIAELDADFESQQEFVALPLAAPVARSLCGVDEDIIPVELLFEGQLVITLTGVPAGLELDLFALDAEDVETPAAVTRVDDETAGTATFSADLLPGRYRARVRAPGAVTTTPYTWNLTLPGLDGVPDNDLCAGAIELVDEQVVAGRTIGGNDDFVAGTCNFQIAGDEARDAFFRFSVAATADVAVTVTGLAGYRGSWGIFALPATGCPADLGTLVPVGGEDDPVCGDTSFTTRQRLRDLPAGDYLVIVDDTVPFFDVPEAGVFQIVVDVVPEGFASACDETSLRDIELAAATEVQTLTLTAADFFVGSLQPLDDAETANCTTANGDEVVLRFTAATTGTLTARTLDDSFDTVLMLRTQCEDGAPEVCDDDGDDGEFEFDSILTAPVVAGTTYFLVVDAFGENTPVGDNSTGLELVVTP